MTRRIAAGLAETGDEWPVMVATQSDAFLDAVSDRPDALVHCRLDEKRRTELARLDRAQVQGWLDDFRGIEEECFSLTDMVFNPLLERRAKVTRPEVEFVLTMQGAPQGFGVMSGGAGGAQLRLDLGKCEIVQ